MRTQDTAQFATLARDTAATVRATVRRWWLDTKDKHVLHVEAERAFVGARPVVVHFSVSLSKTRLPTPTRPPQMEIEVLGEPAPKKTRTSRQKARPAGRKIRSAATKARPAGRKTRSAATKARPASRKVRSVRQADTSQKTRQQRQKRARPSSKKTRRASSRR